MVVQNLTDQELIKYIQDSHDEDCLNELINRHTGLCYDVFGRYSYAIHASGQSPDELLEDKDSFIYNAALTYNPQKSKYTTYLANKIKYACLDTGKKRKLNRLPENYEEEFSYEENYSDKDLTDFLLTFLTDKKAGIIIKYYFEGKNLTEIGKDIGLTCERIRQLHNEALEDLKFTLDFTEENV